MKNLLAILSILVVFASCSDKAGGWHSAPELRTAHELMQERPDSALKVLIGFDFDDSTSRSVVNEYQILVAEALYKNYCQQTNAHAVIDAAAYYDSVFEKYPENSGLAFETARAHYYKAVGETEDDDIVAACADYLKAADIMEAAFPEIAKAARKGMTSDGDYVKARFVGLIYNNVGIILFGEQMPNLAAKMFRRAIAHFNSANDTSSKRMCIANLANSYVSCGRYEDAETSFGELMDDMGESSTMTDAIMGDIEILNYNRSRSDESLGNIKAIINDLESQDERKRFEFALAEIYYDRDEFDSAMVYYTRSIDRNKYTMMRSSECLGNIYKSLNDNVKAAYYDSVYKSVASVEMERNIGREELSAMVNAFFSESQARSVAAKKVTYTVMFVILLSVAALSIAVLRGRRMEMSSAREEEFKTQLAAAERRAEQSETELAAVKNTQDSRDVLRRKLESLVITENFGTMMRNLETSDICKSLRNRLKGIKIQTKNIGGCRHLAMTKNEINDLMSEADRCLPLFGRILSEDLGVNRNNHPYCILQLLDFSTAEIAVLMNSSYSAVAKRNDFIKKKLQTDMNIRDFLDDCLSDTYKA